MPPPGLHTRAFVPALPARGGHAHRRADRLRSARCAVAFGALVFTALTLGLAAATETVKPEWRDPEYGYRLKQLRQWQRDRPDRPLVLVVGSSLAQQSISPAAMDLADEPRTPLVYNLGYRAAVPVGVSLQFDRALDDGVRPRALLIVLSGMEIRAPQPPEESLVRWAPRLSRADLRRLEPLAEDRAALREKLGAARPHPWGACAPQLIDGICPVWRLSAEDRLYHTAWSRMDRYGFSPFPTEYVDPALAARRVAALRAQHGPALNSAPTGAVSVRAYRAMVARCRAEGIAVAATWAPESRAYREMYTAAGRATNDSFERFLVAELGVPVFPAPTDFAEADFGDAYHLTREAAERYSRRLADAHLKPWLAAALK